jgi:hypothetical protein
VQQPVVPRVIVAVAADGVERHLPPELALEFGRIDARHAAPTLEFIGQRDAGSLALAPGLRIEPQDRVRAGIAPASRSVDRTG